MTLSEEELQQRLKLLKEGLKTAAIKMTHQRLEIFREVAKSIEHPDAETIYRGVRKSIPTVSLDTVYRTLWMLVDLGLITTLSHSRGKTRFDANMSVHHHFVCVKCGMTRDFLSEEYDRMDIPEDVKAFGDIEKMQVEIRGICFQCARTVTPTLGIRRNKEKS